MRFTVVGLLVAAVLSGCGSSATPPSSASPAALAPAGSVAYLELTVRPQGTQQTDAESALTRLLGHSPDAAIQATVNKLFRHAGLTYGSDVRPWLGQRIALVAKSFSKQGFGLIAPTNDPAAALSALRHAEKGAHLAAATYSGVHYQVGEDNGSPVAIGIVGRNAVIAGPPTFTAIVDAFRGRSLGQNPSFAAALATLPPDALVRGYVDLARLGARIHAALQALTAVSSLPAGVLGQFDAGVGKLHGALTFSLAVDPRAFTLAFHSSGARPGRAGDVSGLAGQSWLALASASLGPGRNPALLGTALRSPTGQALLSRVRAATGLDLIHDVLPSLGPFELSVQGTSLASLGAGLAIRPANLSAGRRLLAAIHRLAARSSSLAVQGSDKSFSISKAGLPIPRALVGLVGHQLVATVDESFDQLLRPGTRLATNPDFIHALGRLPAGSHVSFFLDFRALGSLLGALPSLTSAQRDRKVLQVLQRLDSLTIGSDPTGGTQIVLALR